MFQGFVRLPIHFRQTGTETSGGVGGGMVGKRMAGPKAGGAGHLDKLFAAGQAHASQQEQVGSLKLITIFDLF